MKYRKNVLEGIIFFNNFISHGILTLYNSLAGYYLSVDNNMKLRYAARIEPISETCLSSFVLCSMGDARHELL